METVRTSGRFFRGGLVESETAFLRLIVMGRGIAIGRYRNSLL